jgi:hypothetical protein
MCPKTLHAAKTLQDHAGRRTGFGLAASPHVPVGTVAPSGQRFGTHSSSPARMVLPARALVSMIC